MYATHAHVFQIDPQTKKKWLPSSTQAVRTVIHCPITIDPNRKNCYCTMENKRLEVGHCVTPELVVSYLNKVLL